MSEDKKLALTIEELLSSPQPFGPVCTYEGVPVWVSDKVADNQVLMVNLENVEITKSWTTK